MVSEGDRETGGRGEPTRAVRDGLKEVREMYSRWG